MAGWLDGRCSFPDLLAAKKSSSTMAIDPDLGPFIAQVTQAFAPGPEHMEAADFRALAENLNAQAGRRRPVGVTVVDQMVQAKERKVPVRIYRSAGAVQAALLFIHGGGWTVGSVESYDTIAADIAVSSQSVVVSVEYALAPEQPYPAGLLDCEAAAHWLIAKASSLGIDPRNIAIGGDSAGANIAAGLCLKMRDEEGRVSFCLQWLLYPALDTDMERPSYLANADAPILNKMMMGRFLEYYLGDNLREPDSYAMPLRANSLDRLPPAFISAAGHDPLRDDGRAYASRLIEAGVPCEYRENPILVHGHLRARAVSQAAATEFAAACDRLRRAFNH